MEIQTQPSGASLQVMSDLHLETPKLLPMYSDFRIESRAGQVALLGDIGNASDERLFMFLENLLQQFELVFYILGNHEPYESEDENRSGSLTYRDACQKMQDFEESIEKRRQEMRESSETNLGQFVFMNRRRWNMNDTTTILGCTLFSHISKEQESTASLFVSDFSNIADWTVDSHNNAHTIDLAWLNDQVATISRDEPNRRIMILTHYSPTSSHEANDPDHLEDPRGVQSAFVTDLSAEPCWTNESVKVWMFGHTHWNCDYVEKKTGKRVVANQRGYGREDIFDFDPEKVVTLS